MFSSSVSIVWRISKDDIYSLYKIFTIVDLILFYQFVKIQFLYRTHWIHLVFELAKSCYHLVRPVHGVSWSDYIYERIFLSYVNFLLVLPCSPSTKNIYTNGVCWATPTVRFKVMPLRTVSLPHLGFPHISVHYLLIWERDRWSPTREVHIGQDTSNVIQSECFSQRGDGLYRTCCFVAEAGKTGGSASPWNFSVFSSLQLSSLISSS